MRHFEAFLVLFCLTLGVCVECKHFYPINNRKLPKLGRSNYKYGLLDSLSCSNSISISSILGQQTQLSIFSKIRSKLPTNFISNLMKARVKSESSANQEQQLSLFSSKFPFLEPIWKFKDFVKTKVGLLLKWVYYNRGLIMPLMQYLAVSMLGVMLMRSIISWMTSKVDCPILLDNIDVMNHPSTGGHLDPIAMKLINQLNTIPLDITKTHGASSPLISQLKQLLTQCNDVNYLNTHDLQDTIAYLLTTLDSSLSLYQRHSPSIALDQISSFVSLPPVLVEETIQDAHYKAKNATETTLFTTIQHIIAYLQAKQADCALREMRKTLLTNVNHCEDMLMYWQGQVIQRTAKMTRKPTKLVSRSPTSMVVGESDVEITSTTSSVVRKNKVEKGLQSQDKVMILEKLRDELYILLSQIQSLLGQWKVISLNLSTEELMHDSDVETEHWKDCENWTKASHQLINRSIDLITFQTIQPLIDQNSNLTTICITKDQVKKASKPSLLLYPSKVKSSWKSKVLSRFRSKLVSKHDTSSASSIHSTNSLEEECKRTDYMYQASESVLTTSKIVTNKAVVIFPTEQFTLPVPIKECINQLLVQNHSFFTTLGTVYEKPWIYQQRNVSQDAWRRMSTYLEPWLLHSNESVAFEYPALNTLLVPLDAESTADTQHYSYWLQKASFPLLQPAAINASSTASSLLSYVPSYFSKAASLLTEEQTTYAFLNLQHYSPNITAAATGPNDTTTSQAVLVIYQDVSPLCKYFGISGVNITLKVLFSSIAGDNDGSNRNNERTRVKIMSSIQLPPKLSSRSYLITALKTPVNQFSTQWKDMMYQLILNNDTEKQSLITEEEQILVDVLNERSIAKRMKVTNPVNITEQITASQDKLPVALLQALMQNVKLTWESLKTYYLGTFVDLDLLATTTNSTTNDSMNITTSQIFESEHDSYTVHHHDKNGKLDAIRLQLTIQQSIQQEFLIWKQKMLSPPIAAAKQRKLQKKVIHLQTKQNSPNKKTLLFDSLTQQFDTQCKISGLTIPIPYMTRFYQQLLIPLQPYAKLSLWLTIFFMAYHVHQHSNQLTQQIELIWDNMKRFVERRIMNPTVSIVNDVFLNKHMAITDPQALQDTKRSLQTMIYDFLTQHYPNMNEQEKKSTATKMDMRPISEEYERELKQPLQSIVSGRIARIMFIQLQFVKKELLVAMQAIDQLFNANQVNLQLLAITPAVVVLLASHMIGKVLWLMIQSSSQGKEMASKQLMYATLRIYVRQLERDLLAISMFMNQITSSSSPYYNHNHNHHVMKEYEIAKGKLFSHLYRIHVFLQLHQVQFDPIILAQFQEDLRDIYDKIADDSLSTNSTSSTSSASSSSTHFITPNNLTHCHYIFDRMYRYFAFLQPHHRQAFLESPFLP